MGTTWEHLRQEIFLYLLPSNSVYLTNPPFHFQTLNDKAFSNYPEDGGMFLLRNRSPKDHDTTPSNCRQIWQYADHGLKTLSYRVKWKGGGAGCPYSNAWWEWQVSKRSGSSHQSGETLQTIFL
jgi:hypothetical protein